MHNIVPTEPGFVIHMRPYKEQQGLYDFYTLNYGHVSAIVRFTKKNAASLKATLQPFVPLQLNFVLGKRAQSQSTKDLKSTEGLWHLQQASRASGEYVDSSGISSQGFSYKLPTVFLASYLNELIYHLLRQDQGDPQFFAFYVQALIQLHSQTNFSLILRQFETKLLDLLGYGILFEGQDGKPFIDEQSYYYLPESGFSPQLINSSQLSDNTADKYVFSGKILNLLSRQQIEAPGALSCLRVIHEQALNHLLNGKILQSKKLYFDYMRYSA